MRSRHRVGRAGEGGVTDATATMAGRYRDHPDLNARTSRQSGAFTMCSAALHALCVICTLPPQNPTTTNKRAHTHASHLRSFRSDVCRHDVQPMAAPGRRRPHAHALRSPPMISSDDPRSDAEPTGGGGQPSPNANPASVHARASRWALSTSGWVLRRLLLCVAEFEELLRTVDQTMRNKPLLPTPTPPLSGSRARTGWDQPENIASGILLDHFLQLRFVRADRLVDLGPILPDLCGGGGSSSRRQIMAARRETPGCSAAAARCIAKPMCAGILSPARSKKNLAHLRWARTTASAVTSSGFAFRTADPNGPRTWKVGIADTPHFSATSSRSSTSTCEHADAVNAHATLAPPRACFGWDACGPWLAA